MCGNSNEKFNAGQNKKIFSAKVLKKYFGNLESNIYGPDIIAFHLNYLGENMDQGFEPEPNGTRWSKMGYPCDECEYVATRTNDLKRHVESKHKGVRYPCPECEYAATTASHLKKHMKKKHEELRYPCSQ